jgi:Cu(I)/Ag(I) efflux system membrane fusion protein
MNKWPVMFLILLLAAAGTAMLALRAVDPVNAGNIANEQSGAVTQPTAPPPDKGRILYYRNPMGLPDTSPAPKKDSMGMEYIPVYENESAAGPGVVQISPGKLQLLGVRTAPVESRKTLSRTVRATGTVEFNERTLAVVTTKVGGWIEALYVSATGETVKRGDPLFKFYAPELVAAEEEFIVASSLAADRAGGTEINPQGLLAAAAQRLRALGAPSDEIERLKRTGTVNRAIAIRAPADGIVIEKAAIEGMRVETNSVLYRTADLSTVWLIAQVQERDLGGVAKGLRARASFVAFPGRTFEGAVDFVYPTLSVETRTAQVRILVPNPGLALRAAMYASVEIETPAVSGEQNVLTVPDSAIIDSGARQVVLVERGEGRFEPREVRLGIHGDGYTEVTEGLKDGEHVVVGANFLIDSESNLRAALQGFMPAVDGAQ